MTDEEKIVYFNSNITSIWQDNVHMQKELPFIYEYIDDKNIINSLKEWPSEIKIAIIDKLIQAQYI